MSALDCNNEETDEELKSWQDWIGHRVSISGVKFGILRYFGKTHFAEGSWCGVELDEPVGKNNGTVKDVRYFTCKENFGIFAPLSKMEKIPDSAGTSGGISIASKSKLPHPKSKLKFIPQPKTLPRTCETTFREPAKSHLPYFSSNVNDLKTNAANEVYSKQHRFSDSFLENKKYESNENYFNSNNNKNSSFFDMGHVKIAERNTSTPVDNLFRKYSEKRTVDLLNQTVILNDNKKTSSYPQQNISLGILPGDFMLNTTFNVFGIQSLDNEPADKGSTFVVGNVFSDELSNKSLEGRISSEEDPISAELEESLGILSPSQMKDFTLSFDNSGNAIQKSPKIHKIESCDDVNELPEFEDNRMYEGLMPDESLDTITEPCSERHWKDRIVCHSTQIVYPKEQSSQKKGHSNVEFQEDSDDKSVEYCLTKTPAQKLLPRELEHLKYDYDLSDFHPLEDINFNVPSATSTPTFLSKPSRVAISKRHLNSDLHSIEVDQIIPSTVLNQTYSHPGTNEYPSTPKINVISKLLSDLDPIQLEPFQTAFSCSQKDVVLLEKSNDFPKSEETHTFESSGSTIEIPVIGECLPNNLNQEATSAILESALELNISSVEKKHSTSSVKFLANNQPLFFSPVNDVGVFKLQDRMNSFHSDMTNSLEENNKVICVQQEYVDGSMESLSVNHSEKSSCDANKTIVIIPKSDIESDSHKNEDNGELKILCGKKVEESNFLDAFCYQNTVSKSMTLSFHDHKLDKDSISEIVDDRNHSTKSGGSSVIKNVIKNCNDEDCKINVIPSENMKSNNNIELMKTQVIETSDIASSETEAIIEKNEIAIKDIFNETTILNSTSSTKINLCIQDDIGDKVIPDTSKEVALKNHIIPQADIEKCIFDDVTTEPKKLESPVFSVSSSVISKETENEYENKTNSLDVTRVIHIVECKENSYSNNCNVTSTSTDVKSVKKSNTSCDKNIAKSVSGPKNIKNNVGKPVNSKKPDEAKNVSVKLPKKNVVSKIKMMLESSKINSASNQENVNSKPHTTNSKKVGKWDTVTSRIAASLADNKKKMKKEVTSRVNTNLNASRQLTPKTSPRPSIAKCTKRTENKKSQLLNETTVSTNLKNTVNSQKGCDDLKSVCSTEENAERDIRILSQLQNVSDCNKPAIGLKETSVNLKKKKLGLSKAPDRASQSDSASSFGSQVSLASSKIATLQQKSSNPLRIVPNRSQKANPTSLSNASIGIKEKEQPAKNVSTIRNKTTQLSVGSKVQTTRSSSKVTEVKSVNSRWSSPRQTPSKINAEPRKFISKTELVKEIQELGVLCESRTKELNMLKIQHRHAVLGFEALAVLNKHMVQQYDPFSHPQLVKNYKKAKDELKKAAELLQLYQVQLEELKSIHGDELLKLTTKLEEAYSGEIKELKTNHAIELKEMDSHHKEQVKKLKESFKNESAEREQNHCEQFKELQESYQKQKIELEKSHARKLDEIDLNHQEIQNELQNNIKILHHQYETLQKQLQEMEEAFKRDKNAKIQYISAKKTELEKEVDSLKAVLEIKSSQIQGLHNENVKMKKELEELPIAKEKIKNLENKTEDLKAMMQEKMRMQRELSNENQQLAENCEKESRVNIHLSMVNEELQWRLQQSKESTLRSASLSASPVLWSSEYHSAEGNRSDSRMSLPILQSEKFGILSDSLKHNPSKLETETNIKCHSMSLSWHPVLPTHVETVTSKTSSFARSSELQIDKNTKSNFSGVSKLSSKKQLKEDDEFLKRRSQLTTNQILVNHPMSMSWGGESFADYYEDLDDSYFKDLSSEDSKSKFLRRMPSKQEIIKQKEVWMRARSANHSPTTSNNQNKLDLDQDVDKSLSGIISLQSSYTSDSSCSYVPTQPGSEESSSCSNKSQDNDSKNNSDLMVGHDTDPFGRKYPRNLAGEAMIQDIDSIAPISHQTKTNIKDRFDQVDEISSSSPEESKEKFINPVSMTTPSIDTLSSQGMADSTNLDVSWGDEEMLSENDS